MMMMMMVVVVVVMVVKAVCAGKTMSSLENACHIPERLRGVFTTIRHTNPRLPLPLPLPMIGAANALSALQMRCFVSIPERLKVDGGRKST